VKTITASGGDTYQESTLITGNRYVGSGDMAVIHASTSPTPVLITTASAWSRFFEKSAAITLGVIAN
jgi:hypothetical protein